MEKVRTRNEKIMDSLGLTGYQMQVVELIMRGLSNEEIALNMHRDVKAVKSVITNIYKRTGLDSRARFMAGLSKVGWKMDAVVREPGLAKQTFVPTLSVGSSKW